MIAMPGAGMNTVALASIATKKIPTYPYSLKSSTRSRIEKIYNVIPMTASKASTRKTVVTCEERTEVFFVTGCALLVFFIESCLFAFFDGDTDDLHCRGIAVVWVTRRNGHQYIQTLHYLTEDAMLII